MALRRSRELDKIAVSKSSWLVRLMSSFSESRYLRQKEAWLEALDLIIRLREEKSEGGWGRV